MPSHSQKPSNGPAENEVPLSTRVGDSEDDKSSHRKRRGYRIDDAPDEPTRNRLREEAEQRRRKRQDGAAERRKKRRAKKLEDRRCYLAGRALRDSHESGWDAPGTRKLIDAQLTDARERKAFRLPPLAESETTGLHRLLDEE